MSLYPRQYKTREDLKKRVDLLNVKQLEYNNKLFNEIVRVRIKSMDDFNEKVK